MWYLVTIDINTEENDGKYAKIVHVLRFSNPDTLEELRIALDENVVDNVQDAIKQGNSLYGIVVDDGVVYLRTKTVNIELSIYNVDSAILNVEDTGYIIGYFNPKKYMKQIEEKIYKLWYNSNQHGCITSLYTNKTTVLENIENFNCANAYEDNGELVLIDNECIDADDKFIREIDNRYKAFEAKSRLLGLPNIQYIIEKKDVVLLDVSGDESEILLPGCITKIPNLFFTNSPNITKVTGHNLLYDKKYTLDNDIEVVSIESK